MAKIAVHIQGKDDTKAAIASAKSGISSMNSTLSSLKNTMNMVAGIMAFDKLMAGAKKAASVVRDLTDAYEKQEQAEIRLSAAAINNINLTSKNVAALKEYAAELQKRSIFGDEEIIQQEAMLATMELNEQQIRDVMRAAVDLASTGMMSLDSATKNLSKTFSGQRGELGELIPGLRNLTEEQLKAGEAVTYIQKQYAGMAEAVASGVSGQQQQIKNQIGDIKEQLASAITPVINTVLEKIKPILNEIAKWLSDHQNQLVSFFVNFPEIAGVSFRIIKKLLEQVFSIDFLETLASAVWKMFLINAKNSLLTTAQFIRAIAVTLWEPLSVGFEWAGYGIKKAWRATIDALVDAINFLLTPINALLRGLEFIITNAAKAGAAVQAFIKHPFDERARTSEFSKLVAQQPGVSLGTVAVQKTAWGSEIAKPGGFSDNAERMEDAWSDAFNQFKTGSKEGFASLLQFGEDLAPTFTPILKEGKDEIVDILDRNVEGLIKPVVATLDALNDTAKAAAAKTQVRSPDKLEVGAFEELGKPVVDLTSRYMEMESRRASDAQLSLWQVVKTKSLDVFSSIGSMMAGPLSFAANGLIAFAQYIWGAIQSTEAYQNIMSSINTMVSNILSTVVGPLFDDLRPLIDVFLQIISIIAQFLIPIIQMVGAFIASISPLFMALVPILSAVMQIIQTIIPIVLVIGELLANGIAPILNLLTPVLDLVASLFMMLVPIIGFVAKIFDVLSRPVEFVADLFVWLGSWIAYFGKVVSTAIYNIMHPFRQKGYGSSPGGFSSDAFSRELIDIDKYMKYSIDEATSNISSADLAATGTVSGSTTTVARVPDNYFYIYFQAPVVGAGGLSEAGEFFVKSVQAYAGIGGKIEWENA